MIVIGLTGSFGTGKSFVASIFRKNGAKVLDADRIARSALKKDSASYRRVVSTFGQGILGQGKNIDRKKLAAIVFKDKKKLKILNGIIHPEVIRDIKKRIAGYKRVDVVVIDAPLLVEAKLTCLVDKLIVVKASQPKQIYRCMRKFNMTEKECRERIANQLPLGRKVKLADYVIDNDGTKTDTIRQANKIWREILWK